MENANLDTGTFQILFDSQQNVITKHEEQAVSAGIPDVVRRYLLERMISHRMDCALAPDADRLSSIRGRILELQALLGLFKV